MLWSAVVISIVAHDKIQLVEDSKLPITNVEQDYFKIGSTALKRLFEIMVNPSSEAQVDCLPVTFNNKGSVLDISAKKQREGVVI